MFELKKTEGKARRGEFRCAHGGTVQNLLGDEQNKDSELRYFSGELNVTDDTPTAFIWHTANDNVVPVEQSLTLAQALSHAMVPYELHIYTHGRHGLALGMCGSNSVNRHAASWVPLCKQWLGELFHFEVSIG